MEFKKKSVMMRLDYVFKIHKLIQLNDKIIGKVHVISLREQ